MRTAIIGLVLAMGVTAAAEPAPKAKPAAMTGCKKVVVGKGLDRKVTCEVETPIVVPAAAPKPNVAIVHTDDGRKVTGRPRTGDRFSGLSHDLR